MASGPGPEEAEELVTENQPDGTPTWIDLGVPDLEGPMAFYRALFGSDLEVGHRHRPVRAGFTVIARPQAQRG